MLIREEALKEYEVEVEAVLWVIINEHARIRRKIPWFYIACYTYTTRISSSRRFAILGRKVS